MTTGIILVLFLISVFGAFALFAVAIVADDVEKLK